MIYRATSYQLALSAYIIFLCASVAFCDGSSTGAEEYYRYDVGMQAAGMAGAVVSRVDNVSAMYYNPAGLAGVPGVQLLGTFQDIGFDSFHSFLGLVLAKQKWMGGKLWNHLALGGGWVHKESHRSSRSDADDTPQRSFGGDEGSILVALATRFPVLSSIDLSLGINHQVLYRNRTGYDLASSTSLGLQARLMTLRLGLACLNCNKPEFEPDIDISYKVPRIVVVGLAYEISRDFFNQSTTAALEWNLRSESGGSTVNMVGFEVVSEFAGLNRLALRAGYAIDDGDFSLGLGFRLPLGRIGADVDFLPIRNAGPNYVQSSDIRLSATLTYLGKKEEPKDDSPQKDVLPPIPDVIIPGSIGPGDTTDTNEGQ